MNKEQAKEMVKLAKGLFPTMTADEGKLLAEMLLPFDLHRATAVLKTHKINHEYFSFPQFAEGLKSDEARRREQRTQRQEDRVIDWLRRQMPPGDKTSDASAIIYHYADCWDAVKNERDQRWRNIPDHAKQYIRKMILGHCRAALLELDDPQWTEAAATKQARDIVDLVDGQRIEIRPMGVIAA